MRPSESLEYTRWDRQEDLAAFLMDDQQLKLALLADQPPEWPEQASVDELRIRWRSPRGQDWVRDNLAAKGSYFESRRDLVVSADCDLVRGKDCMGLSQVSEPDQWLKPILPELLQLSGWLAFSLYLYDASFVLVADADHSALISAADEWRRAHGLEVLKQPALVELVKWA